MRVIIADIRSRRTENKAMGHYFTVASNYLDIFKDSVDVLVAGGPLYTQKYEPKQMVCLDYDTQADLGVVENKRRELHNLKQLLRGTDKDDVIIFQCSAIATVYAGVALYAKGQRIYLIQYNTYGIDSIAKKILFTAAKKKINGVICPTDEIGKAYRIPYCVVPDYVYVPGKKDEETISYNEKEYDFAFVGLISKDKGVIEAVTKLAKTSYKTLVAGRPENAETENIIRKLGGGISNITLKLGYLSEEEYSASISNSRYCILNYSEAYSEHSSGVVFDILFRLVPVIGSNCASLAFINENNMGEIYEDISEWNPGLALDEVKYEHYQHSIRDYLASHEKCARELISFTVG